MDKNLGDTKAPMAVLEQLYQLHDQALADLGMGQTACGKGCDRCCTCNVTLTHLEADYILRGLNPDQKREMGGTLETRGSEPRYRPALSMNAFARYCVEGLETPEEDNDPDWGQCPLLADGACTIYPMRPFGCRSLVSSHSCAEKGYADMEPVILFLNNIFIQFIEDLDRGGVTGNFTDLMLALLAGGGRNPGAVLDKGFAANEPIPVLMVEPNHQRALMPVVEKIQELVAMAAR